MVSHESECLVVNSVFVDGAEIVVGATNSRRWDWDKREGLSGADARTIVWVTLTDRGPDHVVREEAELFAGRFR